jgi:hypothetical protein
VIVDCDEGDINYLFHKLDLESEPFPLFLFIVTVIFGRRLTTRGKPVFSQDLWTANLYRPTTS